MDRIDKGALAVAAAILTYQLFVPPIAGLANNGDFGKLIARFNLGAPFENEFRYVAIKYDFDPKYHYESGVYSSELIAVYAALGLNAIVSRDGNVDIRSIGAVHAALFLFSLYLLLPVLRDLSHRVRIALLAPIVFVFSDAMYIAPFNSFYIDTGAWLFLLLAIVLFLRCVRAPSRRDATGFVICCLLLITTKTQHSLLGIPLAALVLWKGGGMWPGPAHPFRAVGATAMLCAAIVTWKAAPEFHHDAPLYTAIFTGLLPGSNNAAEDLKAIGLEASDARYVGTNGFTAGNPLGDEHFLRRFKQRTSYFRLGLFFLKHPASACRVITAALGEAGRQKPNLGGFDRSAGKPEWAESQAFTMWSWAKRSVFYWHGARYLWYSIAILFSAVFVALTRATNGYIAPAAVLSSLTLIELGVSGFGDAAEMARHFFLFNGLLDILLLSAAAALLILPRRREAL